MLTRISSEQAAILDPKRLVSLRAVATVLLIILDTLRPMKTEMLVGTAHFSFVFAFQSKLKE
jgi:hypothetical protein